MLSLHCAVILIPGEGRSQLGFELCPSVRGHPPLADALGFAGAGFVCWPESPESGSMLLICGPESSFTAALRCLEVVLSGAAS